MAGGLASRLRSRNGPSSRRQVRCYLCGGSSEVSSKTMSTTCPHCHKAIKIEDITVKTYLPVNDVQTCGMIKVTKRGRIAARRVCSGEGIACEGVIEGSIISDGPVHLGPKSVWKGETLSSRSLHISEGAQLNGALQVPWERE